MWWSIPAGIVAALVVLALLWTAFRKEKNRAMRWDNLRERSKLIASQLSHLRDVQAQRKEPR